MLDGQPEQCLVSLSKNVVKENYDAFNEKMCDKNRFSFIVIRWLSLLPLNSLT